MKHSLIIIVLVALFQAGYGRLVLPKVLGNGMVLQQKQIVPIWGWAEPHQKVVVTFKNQNISTIADAAGEWKITLNPLKASFEPASLSIATNNDKIVLTDVLVGEVWLCSGQSNMEFAMRKISKLQPPPGAKWPVDELETAHNKNIRIFLVDRKKMLPDSTHAGWAAAEGAELRSFSAVGYFFAKELFAKLNVPIGVISAAIPGSRIEPWMPREAMEELDFFKNNPSDSIHKIDGDPGKFYTSMIQPLIPFALKGFLWYQGESNCFLNERLQYSYKMKALINYWRGQWKNHKLPFYYIQIAPYNYSKATDRPYTIYSEPEFWEAQAAVLKVPNTVMVATTDLNDNPSDLHPVNKWMVGQRLANAALSKTYHASEMPAMGPLFKSATRSDDNLIVSFDYIGKGLTVKNGTALHTFEIKNESGQYVPAIAIIKNNKVWVSAPGVKVPQAVRYDWKEDAKAELYNKDGLPAMPFRSDNKLESEFK